MRKTYTLSITPILGFLLFFISGWVYGQQGTITGQVLEAGEPLIGATVVIVGTTNGTTTDIDGNYALMVDPGTYTVEASYIGYGSQLLDVTVAAGQTTTAIFTMTAGVLVDEIIVTGTRSANRTNTDAAVPIDVINVEKLSIAAPQSSLNSLLHNTAPSFSSNTQTISDGTDHIDPASLRGLGPDQVLVLLNGKRRHSSSLVNVNGTFGRGSVGTDLNALPAAAVKAIEVLRDGAAAQYGSDAIAGVINVRLKNAVNKLNLSLTTGGNFTSEIGPFEGETKSVDGEVVNLGVNYGLPLGQDGGFINFTGEFGFKGPTNRMQEFSGDIFNAYNAVERVAQANGADIANLLMADVQTFAQQVNHFDAALKTDIANAPDLATLQGLLGADVTTAELSARGLQRSDFNMRVGQSQLREGKFFANMGIPLGDDLELYAFGGLGYRDGESGCFYRLPGQNRTSTSIYPNGTVPRINSNITDKSISTGIRGKIGEWNIDFSNTYGTNEFLFYMTNTHNATLGSGSPTEFNAGGHAFAQNTANLDLAQYFSEVGGMAGINVAFGAEYRFENYKVIPGTELSFGNYDMNGELVTPTTPNNLLSVDFLGRARPAGAQCFAGFLPSNDVDANRSSVAGYFDVEFDISEEFLVETALRYENYTDFGSTFNYKLASRLKVSDNFNLRGAFSSGFRAPSLHQILFSRTSTIFVTEMGVTTAQEVGVFNNNSRAAKLLGIPQLKEETSNNFSLGFTAKFPDAGLRVTVDGYLVNIDDRVILTGQFQPGNDAELQILFSQAQATRAAFFANAIDTESSGLDIVISHRTRLGEGSLSNDLAGTFSKTEQVGDIKSSDILRAKGLVDTYFDETSRIYLEEAVPRTKLTLSNTYTNGKWNVYLRNTLFGETTEATNISSLDPSVDYINEGKLVTDLSIGYQFDDNLGLTIGAMNLLDVYPDEVDPAFLSSGRFVYSRRSPQFSYGGRHLFARVIFTLQ
ncbi:MAG: TonB-dependent receptor [Bacteroidia bacterium]|nr:TonB-dependent receptor [Bacteroidia bacterium]